MKIYVKAIDFPVGCKLEGWEKMVTERRIKSSFSSFFSVCDLDRCRKSILPDAEDCPELLAELSEFHCEKFRDLREGEFDRLKQKFEQYVGVRITVGRKRFPPSMWAGFGLILLYAFGLFAVVWHSPVTSRHNTPTLAEQDILHPVIPAPESRLYDDYAERLVKPSSFEGASPEVYSATVTSTNAKQTASALVSAIPQLEGRYDVSIVITAIEN